MLRQFAVAFTLLLAGVVVAQQKPSTPAHHPAAQPAATSSAKPSLPSEETVNAFLQQMLGYQPSVTWKIVEIKPSVAEGLEGICLSL